MSANTVVAVIQNAWKPEVPEWRGLIKLVNGLSVLETIVKSLRSMDVVTDIILATTSRPEDDPLIKECEHLGIKYFRGDFDDVLGRLKAATAAYHPATFLRVDGNKPLFDPVQAEKLVHAHFANVAEYSFNCHYDGVVYGTECEVIHTGVFDRIDTSKLTQSQKYSGALHIRANPQLFRTYAKKYDQPRPTYKVSLEREEDVEVINNILQNVDGITNDTIIRYLDENPIIASYNQIEKAKEIGLNKIMLFPEKLKSVQATSPLQMDTTYPISVELSLTNRCNFKCVWCSDLDLREEQGMGDIEFDALERLAKDLAKGGTRGVVIEGGGEPTIFRRFDEAVQIFKKEGLSLGLITNGSKRLNEATIREFEWIRVSLDASCPEEMKGLKGYAHFEKVIDNIIFYSQHCPVVGLGYVATNQNTSQIESLILRLRETPVSYIQFRPVVDHPDLSPKYDFDYLKKFQTHNFAVITDGMKENVIKGNAGLPCVSHSMSSVVTADGSVFICGRLNIHKWVEPLGNINKQSFNEIWHGAVREKQSQTVLETSFCKQHCPECRLTKFNVEIDRLKKIKTTNFI